MPSTGCHVVEFPQLAGDCILVGVDEGLLSRQPTLDSHQSAEICSLTSGHLAEGLYSRFRFT